MAARKKDLTGRELVQQHVALLSREVSSLRTDIDKIDKLHDENRGTITELDKEHAKVRLQEEKLHAELQEV